MSQLAAGLLLAALLGSVPLAHAQEATELYDCVGDLDTDDFCSDSDGILVDEGCGATFNRYIGRIAWPALRNVGPVTISVRTRYVRFGTTHLPLYVEVRGRDDPEEGTHCYTGYGGLLVLQAHGGVQCGGTWESVGPVDLAPYGVPFGAYYSLQVAFFEFLPSPIFGTVAHSIGFSCIRVTSHPTLVAGTTWSNVKALFR